MDTAAYPLYHHSVKGRSLEYRFADHKLLRLDEETDYTAGFDRAVVKAFRKRMQLIRAATDERDFHALRSLNYEKLRGKRKPQRSMRLNRQWRLILEIEKAKAGNTVVIVGIEDYH